VEGSFTAAVNGVLATRMALSNVVVPIISDDGSLTIRLVTTTPFYLVISEAHNAVKLRPSLVEKSSFAFTSIEVCISSAGIIHTFMT
jgi:hypothetical protein